MEQVAIIKPDHKFVIKEKGIVLDAIIKEGVVLIGNHIEFKCDDQNFKRKIIGIEIIRRASLFNPVPNNMKEPRIGVLIECLDEDEIIKLGEAKLNRELAIVYKD